MHARWRGNQTVIRTQTIIVTTEAVLWEWLNAFSDVRTRGVAADGYRRIRADSRIAVVPFHADWTNAAVALYQARSDKSWSLTDCLSFVVMERNYLAEALTTDRHFEQAGLRALMLDEPPV